MRHTTTTASLFFVPLLALAAAAVAGTPIEQTRLLDARGRIDIENLKGRIQVRAWERNEVKISGSLGKGVEKLVIEGDSKDLVVKVQYPKNSGWGSGNQSEPTDLQLMVPIRAELDIDSVSADVDVSGVASSTLSIESVSGNVELAAAPRAVDVESVSGDLRITVNSSDVQAQTVSGNIVLRGRMNGEIKTETVSGDIDVLVNGERVRELSSSTVSGDADVHAALTSKGEIKMESVSGSLRLTLPKNLSARVTGETFSGDLKAPGARIDRPEHGPGASFNTRYGAGDGEVHLETFSGDAELRLE
jgi:hypothetical protein